MLNQEMYSKAKNYALRSLGLREQSELQIRQKLEQREYAEDVIEAVIVFLKDYNYLNDERFIEQYIYGHCRKMNRRQIQDKLYTLGFKHIDFNYYLELYQYDEDELLKKAMIPYVQDKDLSNPDVCNKVLSHFMKKGYSFSLIRKNLDIFKTG